MAIPELPGPLPLAGNPPLSFRFSVVFLTRGLVPNVIDTLWESVSGLGQTVETTTINEGGQNLYTQNLPTGVSHETLVLKRGLATLSPLVYEFIYSFSSFNFYASQVMVSLIDPTNIPVSTWLFFKAYPLKWSVSDLDANSNTVVMETMEFSYQRMQVLRI